MQKKSAYLRTAHRGLMLVLLATGLVFCSEETSGDDDGDENDSPEGVLNGSISGSYSLDGPATDESIGTSTQQGEGHAEAHPGGTLNVSITFDAPNANVIGGGIRFGETGPIHVVEVADAVGQTTGTLNFAVQIPASVCDDLSSICHDIKCYEFAVTDAGTVSKANINAVALACGNCDEPSCQDLLTSCEADPCGCTADEVCVDGVCQVATEQNSCALRDPSCCPGQDDSCTAPGEVCFCDAFCTEAGDCCPDACDTCGFCN
jgi:hypothetical protein